MPNVIYIVKFHNDIQPRRLVCKDWQELMDYINRLVNELGPFDWMIRD